MTSFPFKLIIKDYELLIPLKNKEIQITNIDSKKCYKSKITTANGEVVFEIPQNERGDFFSVELINDDEYETNPYYLAKESNHFYTQSQHSWHSQHSQESNQQSTQESTQQSNKIDSNNTNISNISSNSNYLYSSSNSSDSSNSHNPNNSNNPNNPNNPNNLNNPNNPNNLNNSHNSKHSNHIHSAHTAHKQSIYQSKNTTNKILTPNNYQKCPAILYFKAKIYLYFDGFTLAIMQGNNEIVSYENHIHTTLENIMPQNTTPKDTTIQNGTYFINTQEAQELIKTYISNESKQDNIDSANSTNSTNSANSTQSNTNLSLNLYKDKDFTQICCKICAKNEYHKANINDDDSK